MTSSLPMDSDMQTLAYVYVATLTVREMHLIWLA